MRHDDLADQMRAGEVFHGLRLLPGAWAVVRVDGRAFSRLTETHYQKPFDPAFQRAMVSAGQALLEELQGLYAYVESDEISVLLPPAFDLFDREVEKLVSVSAGIASSAFTLAAGRAGHFDGRAWLGASRAAVVDYFRWRQADCHRCALNAWCYWTLRKEGRTASQATKALASQGVAAKNELLFQRGINFNEVPAWQRRGVGLRWERYQKEAQDPRSGARVLAERRRIALVEELPMKEAYAAWLEQHALGEAASA
jgi:tRNA(His) 5'-end guanylyltransferase